MQNLGSAVKNNDMANLEFALLIDHKKKLFLL